MNKSIHVLSALRGSFFAALLLLLLLTSFFDHPVYARVSAADENTHRRIALSPPEAERDENFVVVLGKGASLLLADDDSSLTVQVGKQDPEDKWLDPPVSVPDPYGYRCPKKIVYFWTRLLLVLLHVVTSITPIND
jgi:hypothetical protein